MADESGQDRKASRASRFSLRKRSTVIPRPPSQQNFKIVSSFEIHDEPQYEPVTQEEAEDIELQHLEQRIPTARIEDADKFAARAEEIRERQMTFASRRASHPRRVSTKISVKDPTVVTWDGPDDPANPKNWSTHHKWIATVLVSFYTVMAPIASSMIAPCLNEIGRDLKIESDFDKEMVLSIFVLAFAVGPLFFGPLSEMYGRVRLLQLTNGFYLVWNIACGFAQTKNQLLAFRFLAGLGGSAPSAIGGGVLGDCWWPEQRGKAVAAYSLAPLLGPALGPILGGIIGAYTTWRWVFWVCGAVDAVVQIVGFFYLQETLGPQLLHRKAERLRKETGNKSLHTEFEVARKDLFKKLMESLARPFHMILNQPLVQALSLYMAYTYGLTYLVYATLSPLWVNRYHESVQISGLNYISLSIGYACGTQIIAPFNDRIYAKLKAKHGGVGQPEFRVPVMIPGSIFIVIGLFWYGWSAQNVVHWIMPNIGTILFAAGADMVFQCISTYLIDCYTRYAASAIAAALILRSLAGFGFPLFAPYLYAKLEYGWGNSLLALIAIVIGLPAPYMLWLWGPKLRARSQFASG